MMSNPAFIVEGKTEKGFLSKICGKQYPVRLIGCGGRDACMTAIAHHVSIHCDLFLQNFPVVIVFDRDDRKESSEDLRVDFLKALENNKIIRKNKIDISRARVGVPDKMIENWIIADHALMSEEFGAIFTEDLYDGKGGKAVIKRLMKNTTYGESRNYKEARNGVELLTKLNIKRAAMNSPSLQNFLNDLDITNCWWMEK